MEEMETQKTKVSDSGYSNSCSNSQSQRSSGSSKFHHSTSSGSSGYCAHLTNNNDGEKLPDKEHKKKKDGQNSLQQSSTEHEPLPPVSENVMREENAPQHSDVRCHETLQLAALNQTLSTVKRLRSKEQSPDVEISSPREKNITQWSRDEVMQLVNEEMTHEDYMRSKYCSEDCLPMRTRSYGTIAYPFRYHPQEELGIIVSMEDGLVLYITPALTDILSYPKDLWIGRSLIDLIHPKHRTSFAEYITSVIAHDGGTTRRTPYSCNLRQYRGLRSSGFSVTEKWVGYLPLQLNISFQQTIGEAPKICLVITASQITSAYKYGDEIRVSAKFTTRHTASSQLCHVDPEVTPYFGYLPQDILGRSILEFYHPEDLRFLKEVYEAVIKEEGHLFRSKPYRFRCQNGGFALVETELSSFINPWSRKLEFIIGQHTVLRGPPNPDVTTPVAEPEAVSVSEELLKEAKIVHEEIKHLLNNTVERSCKTAKQQVTKRCKDLAAFMENLMDELTKPPDLRVDVPMEEQSFSERDSVMLGEISPYHELYDSKSPSGTPPSYNQLNYNENIQRFFESKPKTTLSEESSKSKVGSCDDGITSPVVESVVDSKSGESSVAQSSESNKNSGESNVSPSKNNPSKKFKPAMLTKQLLSRHNEDMEKQMVQKHREQRSKSDKDLKIKERLRTTLDKPQEESTSHGVKRSSSHSWEGEPSKAIKSALTTEPTSTAMTNAEKQATILPVFPPSQELPPAPFASTLMPMYYVPNKRPDLLFPQQIPYIGGMVYEPVMFSTQPLVYAPLAVIPSHDRIFPTGSVAHEETTPPAQKMSINIKHGNDYRPSESGSPPALEQKTESNDTSEPFDDSSSSFYPFLKTDNSDDSLQSSSENETKQEEASWQEGKNEDEKMGPVKKVAPWIEDINITPELILKYQTKDRPMDEVLYEDLQALKSITQEELGIIVSMEDGVVLHITPALNDILGYPKDMWIRRSLIDLIHPKHRASFVGHITSVIANDDAGTTRRTPYSCYLRQYRGLRSSGFSVTEKWIGYLPLQLNISFQQTIGKTPQICLVITAAQIKSAYEYGDETRVSAKFTTRHTASSQLCHVDPEVTPYFGYLPQDILGRSILEFYHPEDLQFLKAVYEAVIKEEGHLFRSKPYRFRCQNGGFALVETELSSFINPWSRKLEFIIGQHTVLRGPPNPDVTTPVAEPEAVLVSEELLKEAKIVHEEIKHLLNNTVVRSCKTAKQQVTKRCKDLAAFMENLMDELTKPPDLRMDVPMEEQSFSERDSVMLGEISPHHEFYDSKSSSETPPSYNQLNYNENIQRFFKSKPKTTISEEPSESKVSSSEDGKTSPVIESVADSKRGESSGAQSSESNKNSGESNISPPKNNPSKKFKPTMLTKQLLSRHNEDMEKRMVQKHREQRSKSDRDLKIKDRLKTTLDKPQEESTSHGIKRSSSHSWEEEPSKAIKSVLTTKLTSSAMTNAEKQATILPVFAPNQELPPPPFASTLMSMYYLPNKRPDLLFSPQIPYVGGMVYQPVMFGTQPLVYAPLAVIPSPDLTRPPGSGAHGETTTSLLQMSTDIKHGNSNYRPGKCSSPPAQDQKTESNDTSIPFDDSSSSFYSFLKTDKSDESLQSSSENDTKPVVAPWIEDINITPELILKYQVKERPIEEVLYQDLQALKAINQPELVSEQLSQMYIDLELEGLSKQLTLEEASSSSESSGDEAKVSSWQKNNMEYGRMVILFEEDAPLPSPLAQGY